MSRSLPLLSFLIATSLMAVSSVRATLVFSEDFDGLTALPASFTAVNNTNATSTLSVSEGNPAPSVYLNDANTSQGTSVGVYGNQWAAFSTTNPSESTFQVSFDWKVASSLSSAASTMRVNVSLGGTTATTVSIGFGHASVNSADTNFFYAAGGTSGVTPSSSNAIGYNGSSFYSGFSFGTYNSSTASANNTGSGYYRFTLTYDDMSTDAELTVTNLSNLSETTTITISGITATSVSNTSGRYIQGVTGFSGTGEGYIDNINLQAIPEPEQGAALMTLGAFALFLLYYISRRRSGTI